MTCTVPEQVAPVCREEDALLSLTHPAFLKHVRKELNAAARAVRSDVRKAAAKVPRRTVRPPPGHSESASESALPTAANAAQQACNAAAPTQGPTTALGTRSAGRASSQHVPGPGAACGLRAAAVQPKSSPGADHASVHNPNSANDPDGAHISDCAHISDWAHIPKLDAARPLQDRGGLEGSAFEQLQPQQGHAVRAAARRASLEAHSHADCVSLARRSGESTASGPDRGGTCAGRVEVEVGLGSAAAGSSTAGDAGGSGTGTTFLDAGVRPLLCAQPENLC